MAIAGSSEPAVSNIPFDALSSASIPVQRSTNELARARQVQSKKNFHHSEEVEELDDTAVNSIRDQSQRQGGGGGGEEHASEEGSEERVEIESLKGVSAPAPMDEGVAHPSHLDISA